MKPIGWMFAACAALLIGAPASAQNSTLAKAVTVCGTPGNTPVAGNSYPLTADTTGVLCTGATFSGTVTVQGDVAHDGVDSGNPVKTGGKALTADQTAVSSGDRTNGLYDVLGKQVTIPVLRGQKGKQTTTITSSAAETTIVTAGAAGVFLDIYRIIVSNTSASDGSCTIKEATSGTTVWVFAVKAGTTGGFSGDAGSATPQAAAAANWTATCTSLASWIITASYVSTKG
jgi:hypothetical protein